jgi:hypothetical protein
MERIAVIQVKDEGKVKDARLKRASGRYKFKDKNKFKGAAIARESSAGGMLALGGVERAFVQADYGFAGARFDRQDIKAAGGFCNVACAQKLAGHAREVAALFPVHGFFGRLRRGASRLRRREVGDGARLYFYEGERLAVVTYHINFAFDAGRGEIAGDEDVAVAVQVPVGVGFAADAGLARAMFGGIGGGDGWRLRGLRVRGRRCAEAFAGGEVNDGEHETG